MLLRAKERCALVLNTNCCIRMKGNLLWDLYFKPIFGGQKRNFGLFYLWTNHERHYWSITIHVDFFIEFLFVRYTVLDTSSTIVSTTPPFSNWRIIHLKTWTKKTMWVWCGGLEQVFVYTGVKTKMIAHPLVCWKMSKYTPEASFRKIPHIQRQGRSYKIRGSALIVKIGPIVKKHYFF
jgi:hypothetical protein